MRLDWLTGLRFILKGNLRTINQLKMFSHFDRTPTFDRQMHKYTHDDTYTMLAQSRAGKMPVKQNKKQAMLRYNHKNWNEILLTLKMATNVTKLATI